MILKKILVEDFASYHKPAMVLAFPTCCFKCDREYRQRTHGGDPTADKACCQNQHLTNNPNIDVPLDEIIKMFVKNPLTDAIVFGGLEPLDSEGVFELLDAFRGATEADIVIYTGYEPGETKVEMLKSYVRSKGFKNVILKTGRYRPERPSRYDEILKVTLASDNQRAEYI